MKRFAMVLMMMVTMVAFGCGKKTAEQKVEETVSNVHALTADERTLAEINAKKFFEKEWPVQRKQADGSVTLEKERGALVNVRPSDSNFNGLVTAVGMVPQQNGGFKEIKVFCGYKPELVGCSDEDTVAVK